MILFCVCLVHARKQGLGTPGATGVAFQAAYPITGKVLAADNRPLEGATISIQGKQTKVFTNADGAFQIIARDTNSVLLLVSFVGINLPKSNSIREKPNRLTSAGKQWKPVGRGGSEHRLSNLFIC